MTTRKQVSRARRARRGFSLTEVLMAMTLLSVVLLSLAKMSFVLSQRSRGNDLVAKRNSVLIQQANKFAAIPYDTLNVMSTENQTLTAGDFTYTRQMTITTTGTRKAIKVIVVPALDPARKDSVTVHRSKPSGSPLCVGC